MGGQGIQLSRKEETDFFFSLCPEHREEGGDRPYDSQTHLFIFQKNPQFFYLKTLVFGYF